MPDSLYAGAKLRRIAHPHGKTTTALDGHRKICFADTLFDGVVNYFLVDAIARRRYAVNMNVDVRRTTNSLRIDIIHARNVE